MTIDVLIVGGGPAGLAAAIELRRLGAGRVIVADRERQAGGVPRHCAHTGFGLRDLRRVLTGPAYARRYADAAAAAGAEIRCGTTVTELTADRHATLTGTGGIERVTAGAVLLATGCRERPRPARLIPGDRPPGVMTTGELQQRVYLSGQRLPGRALVIGAEHVSFSAMVTLAHAGADVLALVTDQPRHQSFPAFRLAAAARWRVPVWTSTAVHQITGRDQLRTVDLINLENGSIRPVACETLVLTGDWIPDHELARLAGMRIDPGTRGPAVDTKLETSLPLVFAAGNLIHAAETADVAARGGQHAARRMAAALDAPRPALAGAGQPVPVTVVAPLTWISPNLIGPDRTAPPAGRFLLRRTAAGRDGQRTRAGHLEVRQDGALLAREPARIAPGRSIHLDGRWVPRVDPGGGPVIVAAC